MTRNAAVGDLALATGLRLSEFTHLLVMGNPAAAADTDGDPDPVSGAGEGSPRAASSAPHGFRNEALAGLHDYLQLDRAAARGRLELAATAAVG